MSKKDNYLYPINCPVCSGNSNKVLFSVFHNQSSVLKLLQLNTENNAVEIVKCRICSHSYMTPAIRQEIMDKYYSLINSEFYHNAKNNQQNPDHNYVEYRDYGKKIKSLKPEGKILEIGCGNGYLLKTLEGLGYDCYGVEPSPIAYSHAKNELGLKVENKFLADTSYYSQKFDVIILIDVVEHIIEMQKFMEEIVSVLNEGGIIFIGTGDIDSLNSKLAGRHWSYFLSWEHVSFFNKDSMQYLLEKNFFVNIQIIKTSLRHKPLQNFSEFVKNLIKKFINPLLKRKYYHGITFDHFIVTATYKKPGALS